MQDLERICASLTLEELQQLNLQVLSKPAEAKELFEAKVSELKQGPMGGGGLFEAKVSE